MEHFHHEMDGYEIYPPFLEGIFRKSLDIGGNQQIIYMDSVEASQVPSESSVC